MSNFEAVIGLELHIQLNTKSKMFSSAPVTFGKVPNSSVDYYDFAFPGTMPTVNKQAVIYALMMCNALHMIIDDVLMFERKNYFYSDLPKGYQLTQEFRPIGKNGYLTIKLNDSDIKINISRLHLEEDTCKQFHTKDYSYLDYNRAGIPLIEIVSAPEIKSGTEAAKYVEKIRSIVTYLGISDGKMEQGSLRCDVNVSLKRKGDNQFGTKVEIKNLNSISNIQKAIDFEIERQSELLSSGVKISQETRRFDESLKETVLMRVKVDNVDYKCFTDNNIPPIKLSAEFIKTAIESSPELAESKLKRYVSLGLSESDASIILDDKNIANYFEEALASGCSIKLLANWVNVNVKSFINKRNVEIKDFPIKPNELSDLILLIENSKINNVQAKFIFEKMIETGKDAQTIVEFMGLEQVSNEDELLNIVKKVIKDNSKSISDYLKGRNRALGYLAGQVMKETGGKANPQLVNKLLLEEIQRRK